MASKWQRRDQYPWSSSQPIHRCSGAWRQEREWRQPWGSKPQLTPPPFLHFRLDLTRYGPEGNCALGPSPAACPLGLAGGGEIQEPLIAWRGLWGPSGYLGSWGKSMASSGPISPPNKYRG